MKTRGALSVFFLFSFLLSYSQKESFNKKLQAYCYGSIIKYKKIPEERKMVLDELAKELLIKKNIIFTCYTNTRRTVLLQTWMQTAFYYYGIHDRMSFSYGDTVSEVALEVIDVLRDAGFYVDESNTKPKVWVFYTGEKNIGHVIYSKRADKNIEEPENIIVNICWEDEPTSSIGKNPYRLKFQSPLSGTNKKIQYEQLSRQISVEMMYLASKTRELILNSDK